MEDEKKPQGDYLLPASIVVSALIVAGGWAYSANIQKQKPPENKNYSLEEIILPPEGIVLPARWGDLGIRLINSGVIDKNKLESLYSARGGLGAEEISLLENAGNGNLKITRENANFLLNILWALGLGNKNEILEKGPMVDPRYGGAGPPAGGFASTGGWTLVQGNAMAHYSRHGLISLVSEQQQLVERVSRNIYRPCCDNPAYFPDCNHGMAMLGLLELMASQGVSEKEMYKIALQVNAYWFPDTYLTIARFLEKKGIRWHNVKPEKIVGYEFSSASGFQKILAQIEPSGGGNEGGCAA